MFSFISIYSKKIANLAFSLGAVRKFLYILYFFLFISTYYCSPNFQSANSPKNADNLFARIQSVISNTSIPYEIRGLSVDENGNIFSLINRLRTTDSILLKISTSGKSEFISTNKLCLQYDYNLPLNNLANKFGSNFYSVHCSNLQILKIGPSGTFSVFAGADTAGTSDGTVANASFVNVSLIVMDTIGNIFVSDNKTKIRKITQGGVVTTLAGSDAPGALDGTGTSAKFSYIRNMTIDSSGNILVSDNLEKIRKITSIGVVTTLASLRFIIDMIIDSFGNIFVSEGGTKITKITSGGVVTTLAGSDKHGSGDGSGTNASFMLIEQMIIDSSGNIFVSDGQTKIRKITQDGVVTTLAGSDAPGELDGTGTSAKFSYIRNMTI
ncbi:MAG TPA: hypothetical protein PKV80_22380, partial [Leptospiraceae bacterium]|nr:hypothetical protein [Leptospiraceae bacterium]HNM06462.1 hypothetical protein [Leptospiraceae bacterium]